MTCLSRKKTLVGKLILSLAIYKIQRYSSINCIYVGLVFSCYELLLLFACVLAKKPWGCSHSLLANFDSNSPTLDCLLICGLCSMILIHDMARTTL